MALTSSYLLHLTLRGYSSISTPTTALRAPHPELQARRRQQGTEHGFRISRQKTRATAFLTPAVRCGGPVVHAATATVHSAVPLRMLVVPAQQQTADVAELFGGAEVSERAPSTISHLPTLVLVFTALLYSTLRHAVQHYPPQFPSLSTRTHLSFAIAPSPRRQR